MDAVVVPRNLKRSLPALTSAALLVLSFPNFNHTWCAWVAFVPWLVLLRGCSAREAFWWSYAVGAVFFLASMWWLIHVTLVGWLALCAYLALYFALFGWLASCIHHPASIIQHLLLVPSLWVSLEFLRSRVFSGFGWNLLAYSQTPWREVVQLSAVTGAWGVSFLIVMVNAAIAGALSPLARRADRLAVLLVAVIGLLITVWYGTWRISRLAGQPTVRVAVVQGNVPQEEKWDEAYRMSILRKYEALTERAAATHPDLVVWPETSVPGFLGVDEEVTQTVTTLARRLQRPLLIGTPTPRLHGERVLLTNSAMLVDASGALTTRYDKVRLVPFGEFVPFEGALPWLRWVLPPIGDFVPGDDYTVFTLPVASSNSELATQNSELRFSVLICFEDVFPDTARRFVQRGAQLLLVITNDAWFGPTAAAIQHAQASTFRAVELGVPVARAANTGWSGCLDASGQPLGFVQDRAGRALFVDGTHTCELDPRPADTLYLRWGDWFAGLCLLVSLSWLGFHLLLRERSPLPSVG